MQITNRCFSSSFGKRSLGFTYIGLMLIVAIAGIALSGVGIVWKTEMQRENEKELRFAGQQYVAAIASYYECKVCGPNQLPKNLKELLKDSRAPSVVHHIRKLYRDPMTRSNDWGLIKNGDRIMGVYSKSKVEPLAKPYDLDLFKKKNATPSGSSVSGNQTNTNQTNLNQVNANQGGNQAGGTNSNNNNGIGINVPELNKLDTSKTNKPIKPKKPSYQDWQFVYGGASVEQKNISNSQSNLNEVKQQDFSAPAQQEENVGAKLLKQCEDTQNYESNLCDERCANGASVLACRQCNQATDKNYKSCIANISQ